MSETHFQILYFIVHCELYICYNSCDYNTLPNCFPKDQFNNDMVIPYHCWTEPLQNNQNEFDGDALLSQQGWYF